MRKRDYREKRASSVDRTMEHMGDLAITNRQRDEIKQEAGRMAFLLSSILGEGSRSILIALGTSLPSFLKAVLFIHLTTL